MRSVLIVLASIVVAGCFEEAAPVAPASEPETILVTAENDLESLSNETFAMAAHIHDYWGGAERLVVLDTTNGASVLWFGGEWNGFGRSPEDGVVIPHGTSRVEVTLTWTDPQIALYANPELWVKTAADHEAQLVGPVTSGETLVIETDDADADLPHQGVSAWRFEWRIDPPNGLPRPIIRNGGQITMHAEAVRGREIPVYPPHPDLWRGKAEVPLLAAERGEGLWWGQVDRDGLGWSCFMNCPVIHRPENGTVIPYDAALVELVLDLDMAPGHDAGLKWRGATTRNWTDLVPTAVDGGTKTYQIPVEPGVGDSPYASQSVWGFALFSEKPQRDGVFSGSYTLTARAIAAE